MFLFVIALSVVVSGCGDDPKSLVKSSLDDKSGVKISEVYNKKKDDEKSKFAKEVTIAYFEQAKADLSRKNNPSYTQYFYDTLTDLFKHIDSNDKNFANLKILYQLIQTCESKANEYGKIHDQLGLKLEKGKQYTVTFDTLDRSGNGGSEYFMQKQCATYLNSLEEQLIKELKNIIN